MIHRLTAKDTFTSAWMMGEADTSILVDSVVRYPRRIALYITLTSQTSRDNQEAALDHANRVYALIEAPSMPRAETASSMFLSAATRATVAAKGPL